MRSFALQGFFHCAPEGIRAPNLLVAARRISWTDVNADVHADLAILRIENPPQYTRDHPNHRQSVEPVPGSSVPLDTTWSMYVQSVSSCLHHVMTNRGKLIESVRESSIHGELCDHQYSAPRRLAVTLPFSSPISDVTSSSLLRVAESANSNLAPTPVNLNGNSEPASCTDADPSSAGVASIGGRAGRVAGSGPNRRAAWPGASCADSQIMRDICTSCE